MSNQSPKPLPIPLAMSTASTQSAASSKPTPSPIPVPVRRSSPEITADSTRPHPKPSFPIPKLRLEIQDLNHPGSNVFFDNNNPSTALASAVQSVLSILYSPSKTNAHVPPTRSVTLILRAMSGVAYTTGSSLDDDHKEIHFSLDYISEIPCDPPTRQRDEIQGVLVHEMVHCWQWNAFNTAPSGLIEGIADFVRLKAGLSPPHWKKEYGGNWDAGYQHTGYFLEWMEQNWGEGSVRRINDELKEKKYDEDEFWKGLFGKSVSELWDEYSRTFGDKDRSGNEKREQTEKGVEAKEREEEPEASPTKTNDCKVDEEDDELVVIN